MKLYQISLIGNVIQLLVIIALIIVIALKKKSTKCPSLPKGINLESLWTVPKPPSLHDQKVVYVSSGLFNLYELLYTIGLSQLASIGTEASVLADHIPWIYPDNKFATPSKTEPKLNAIIDKIKNFMKTEQIPIGGMATSIAQYKGKGWKSYIPARDGFDMALFLEAAFATHYSEIPNDLLKGPLKGLTEFDWTYTAGPTLLEAVYGFDMFNLLCRCNCFIFNADGIAMDDGSCAEIGIGTARGLPIVIHHDQNTANFPNKVVNPMIAGAQGYNLGQGTPTHPIMATSIPQALELLDTKLQTFLAEDQFEFYHYIPPPKIPSFWANVGYAVWHWKYKKYIIKSDGTLAAPKEIYNKEFYDWMQKGAPGKAYIVAKIILLVNAVKEKYKVTKSPEKTKQLASLLTTAFKLR